MEAIPIQVIEQEVIIPLTYFPKSSKLELIVKDDVAVVRVKAELPEPHENEHRAEMLVQKAVFEAQLETLKQKYLGEYVAYHQGELVDHDPSHKQLVQRINRHYPDGVVLIQQVTASTPAPLRLGSPRLIH